MQPTFPALPDPPADGWTNSVLRAHDTLVAGHSTIVQALAQEQDDPARFRVLKSRLEDEYIPLLLAFEEAGVVGNDWLEAAAYALGRLLPELAEAMTISQSRENAEVHQIDPTSEERTGRRGRPRKDVDPGFLATVFEPSGGISIRKLAPILGMHRHTLEKAMRRHGVRRQFSDVSNADLDEIFRIFKLNKPDHGLHSFIGFLRRNDLRIPRSRIKATMRRADPLDDQLRASVPEVERTYDVTRPNKVWHMDGHHKLIRWGFVIHGFVDGYCRTVVAMRASTNNRASTVLSLFKKAIDLFGIPSRVRGDRGGENILVAVWMICYRGINRASFMWGSSTRNTRIERLWLEVGKHFARRWRAFFTRLERLHGLDPENPHHLWLLHTLFLDQINADCDSFQLDWNLHPISGPRTNNRSPRDLRILGQLEHGVYDPDDCQGIDPNLIRRYYGTDEHLPAAQQDIGNDQESEGEGSNSDNDSDNGDLEALEQAVDAADINAEELDLAELEQYVLQDQEPNVRHDAVEPSKAQCPFTDTGLITFARALVAAVRDGFVPEGAMLTAEEHESGAYPLTEPLVIGRLRRSVQLELPHEIWHPRAVQWVQGLHIMSLMLESVESGDEN